MTRDEEKDPPVPEYLEDLSLKKVHDGKVTEKKDDDESADEQDK